MARVDPPPSAFEHAARVGASMARGRGQAHLVEDFVGESAVIVCAEWPKLVARYGEVTPPLLGTVVERRLTDWLRTEVGRHHVKPHANAILFSHLLDGSAGDGFSWDPADPVDVAEDATVEEIAGAEIVERLVFCVPDRMQDRARVCCERYLAGADMAAIADELGVSESRVSQVFSEIGDYARGHPMSPLAA